MQRDILFRGQRIDTKEWVYGCLVNYLPNENPRIVSCEFFGEQHQHDYKETNHEVIPETVGQFTGLTDKTGNKIFEGDIIEYCSVKDMSDGNIFSTQEYYYVREASAVVFSDGCFCIDSMPLSYISIPSLEDARNMFFGNNEYDVNGNPINESIIGIKVIGNVHENK